MRLVVCLVVSLGLVSEAVAEDGWTECHVSITETTHRIAHHTTTCKAADDTKYDHLLDYSSSFRAPCRLKVDDSSVEIDFEVKSREGATGNVTIRQKNQGVYGSQADMTTTISGAARGSILLSMLPSGQLLATGGVTVPSSSQGHELIHHACDANEKDKTSNNSTTGDAMIMPFQEPFLHENDPAAMFSAPPAFKISYDAFKKGVASRKPFSVTGGGTYSYHLKNEDTDVKSDVSMKVTVGPADSEYEAVYVPSADWDKFVPEGPNPPSTIGVGNTVSLRVELRDKKTHKPSPMKFSIVYGLESSKLGGTCMNWPATDTHTPDEADMVFEKKWNSSGTIKDEGRVVELPMGKGGEMVTVTSRDWGAYARVFGHVTTEDGVAVDAFWTDGTNALSVPKDDDKNHIADQWEKDKGIYGSKALDDVEATQPFANKGDGYTLFAEYRGFVEADPAGSVAIGPRGAPRLMYARLEPARRDLFVGLSIERADDEPLLFASVGLFAKAANVAIHFVPRRTVLRAMPSGDRNARFPRRVDLRTDPNPELYGKDPMVAIWVSTDEKRDPDNPEESQNDSPAFEVSTAGASGLLMSQAEAEIVLVSRKLALDMVEPNLGKLDPGTTGIPPWKQVLRVRTVPQLQALVKKVRNDRQRYADEILKFVLAHELGHAVGAQHHKPDEGDGDRACPMWYFHFRWDGLLAFFEGWDPSVAPIGGGQYTFCQENRPQMHLRH